MSISSTDSIDLGRHARRLRVDTLVRLRWLAIAGQSVGVILVHFVFGFGLPLWPCALVITASAWLNMGLRLRLPVNHRLADKPAAALLAFDILQLSALLFLTGGLDNPFALLFLAPVMISAVSLPVRFTFYLGILAIFSTSLLAIYHLPLPWFRGESFHQPVLYIVGIWAAIALGSAFIGVYASRVAEEARRLSDALAATELILAREQHLTQLDGLAAAAAHELGTPLATITLVVREMAERIAQSDPLHEDVTLLGQEVGRCRTILGKLASLNNGPNGVLDQMRLTHLMEDVVTPQRDFGIEILVNHRGLGDEPICERNPGMIYGLGNLIENAIDFAKSKVVIAAEWSPKVVVLRISDDGPGFAPEVLSRLGEPYVTTRANRKAKTEESSGLGLGLFIAKTLLERSGASVVPANAPYPETGAIITIRWLRSTFERRRNDPGMD